MMGIVRLKDQDGYVQMVLTSTGKVSRIMDQAGFCDLEANKKSVDHLQWLANFQPGWKVEVEKKESRRGYGDYAYSPANDRN